jgi:protein-serine/threonine kinase
MTVSMESKDVTMEISAPPPSYVSNQMTSRIKSFFSGPTTPSSIPPFAVPNDFDTTSQKGFKSNSWFSSTDGNGNKSNVTLKHERLTLTEEENQKAIRRVASAPNAKLLNMTRQQPFLNNNNNTCSTISIPSLMTDSPPMQKLRRTCRRTYSSSSIKVKKVEVGPSSFVKIRMLGKGDVGKVYMVKQKETDKLFAMKGRFISFYCYFFTGY